MLVVRATLPWSEECSPLYRANKICYVFKSVVFLYHLCEMCHTNFNIFVCNMVVDQDGEDLTPTATALMAEDLMPVPRAGRTLEGSEATAYREVDEEVMSRMDGIGTDGIDTDGAGLEVQEVLELAAKALQKWEEYQVYLDQQY